MSRLMRRLRAWVRQGRVEAEIADEMEFHRAAHQAALEREGLTPRDAAIESRRAMGNITLAREDARDVWLTPWIESVWQDAAYALRTLARQPGFAVLAIGALTAGIGLNVSLFTVYAALAMKPWPLRDADRVVRVLNTSAMDLRKRAGGGPQGFSRAEVEYLGQHAKTVDGFTLTGRTVTVRIGDADTPAHWVGGNYFTVLGADLALGRGFTPEEDRIDAPQAVAIVSFGYWQRQFAGDPGVIGREIRLDDVPFTVVGVAGRRFTGTLPERVDVWLPLASATVLRPDDRWVGNVLWRPANCCTPLAGRLAANATREQAEAELNVLDRQFHIDRSGSDRTIRLIGTEVFADPRNSASSLLPAFVGLALILLLACANVGNLLLARAAARRREIAVRLSLGASRWRLVRQLLTESFVLALAAGVTGILVAEWLPERIAKLAGGAPSALQLDPDARVVIFSLAISVASCLLFGLLPALQGTRRDAVTALKDGSALPGARFSLRTLLLSVQVSAVVVLLVSAGVIARSARAAAERVVDPVRNLSVVSIDPPVRGYDTARVRAVAMAIERDLAPAIQAGAVALTSTPPLASGNIKGSFRREGQTENDYNAVFEVSPSYFRIMGLAIVEGRGLEPSDQGRPVIVINEKMATQYWPGTSAVGRRIVCSPPESGWNMSGELEIVGVVRDAYMTSLQEIEPAIFQPSTYRTLPRAVVVTRQDADAAVAAAARIDPRLRIRVDPLEANLAPRLRDARIGALVAGSLGTLALALASIGMFGVFAYWVRQRTQEIGVRMALGARPSDVIALIVGTTARAVALGLVIGLAAAVAGTRLLKAYLFGLSGVDPVSYAAVALILVLASLAAAWVPARRAARIDPLVALRYE